MARRRNRKRDESLAIELMELPWQVSVVLAVIAFVVMRWIIPSEFKSPVLLPMSSLISGFAPYAGIILLFIGVISFFKNKNRSKPALFGNSVNHTISNTDQAIPNNSFSNKIFDPSQDIPFLEHIQQARSQKINSSLTPNINEWSLDLLRKIEWKRFEMLCAEYFRVLGKRVETIAQGADGGIDARVYKDNSDALEFAIQCKSWNSIVGVKHVRELFGVMAHESAGKGIFMTTSWFSDDAKQFAADHKGSLFLIDGEKFLSMISNLPEENRGVLLKFATEGDYITPTCPSCGIKMVQRPGKDGNFWGCLNFPRCRSTLKVATA